MERGTDAAPTPEQVLRWIAAEGGTWFPARHAVNTGTPRASLDVPLNELRTAELVRVADWVRGTGQGYVLTPEGDAVASGRTVSTPAAPAPEASGKPVVEQPPIVTPALVYANLLWYFVGMVIVSRQGHSLREFLLHGERSVLLRLGAAAAPEVQQGEWWRLATACFVHGNIWHLLLNVANLVVLGAIVEHLWGRGRTFILYLVAGFAGSCLALALDPVDANHTVLVHLGASGALCGFFAAILAWVAFHPRNVAGGVTPVLVRRLTLGVIMVVGVSFLPGIGWAAHLGGAIAGFAASLLLEAMHTGRGWKRNIGIGLLAMMPAACLAGLLLATRHSDAWAPIRNPPHAPLPDPTPHLNVVGPDSVRPWVVEATALFSIAPEKWSPQRVKEIRDMVDGFRNNAAIASQLLERNTGDPATDQKRLRAKAFADTRRNALDKLLQLIDAKKPPSAEALKEWGRLHQEANRLWGELVVPPT